MVAVIFAISRPSAVVTLPSDQRTIILTMDVSLSMRASDVEPNRIVAAQNAAKAFVLEQPPDVRIGIVSFAGTANVVQPPTHNRDDLIAAIERFDEVTGGFGGLMVTTVEWASREKIWKSYELIADYVMPRFQGSLVGLEGSNRRSRAVSGELSAAREHGRRSAGTEHGSGAASRGSCPRSRADRQPNTDPDPRPEPEPELCSIQPRSPSTSAATQRHSRAARR